MTRAIFTWFPEYDASLAQTPNVQVTKYGDGYEARIPVGVNNAPEIWTLQFTMASPDLANVLAFVQAAGGVTAFLWTNPLQVQHLYVCRKWKTTHRGNIRIMNFDLEQVFETV